MAEYREPRGLAATSAFEYSAKLAGFSKCYRGTYEAWRIVALLPLTKESERTAALEALSFKGFLMHYPHKSSNIKRARKIGFRARMRTKKGRQMLNRKRRVGRKVQVV